MFRLRAVFEPILKDVLHPKGPFSVTPANACRFYASSSGIGQQSDDKAANALQVEAEKAARKEDFAKRLAAARPYSEKGKVIDELYPHLNFKIRREWWKPMVRRAIYANWYQDKDVRRRTLIHDHAPVKLRLKAMNRNHILPVAFREEVNQEMRALPKFSHNQRTPNSCMFSGNRRGKVVPFRLRRNIFRAMADHGNLCGVIRAKW